MADYRKMYLHLFNEVTDIIEKLQKAQQKTEEIYISGSDACISIVDKLSDKYDNDD